MYWKNLKIITNMAVTAGREAFLPENTSLERTPSPPPWALARLILIALLGQSVMCSGGPIDFTPVTGSRLLEGITFPQLVFSQDGHKITYEPPRGWSYSGNASRLRLSAPDISHGQAIIDFTQLPTAQPLNEVPAQQLSSLVLATLPESATDVQIMEEELSPVRVNQRESREYYATYDYLGQDYETSVIFANVNDVQLRFRLVARKGSFELMHRAFRGSIFSLRWF